MWSVKGQASFAFGSWYMITDEKIDAGKSVGIRTSKYLLSVELTVLPVLYLKDELPASRSAPLGVKTCRSTITDLMTDCWCQLRIQTQLSTEVIFKNANYILHIFG